MKILGSQKDIKEKQQALAAELMDSPQFKGQLVDMDDLLLEAVAKTKDINDNNNGPVEKQAKMDVSMDNVSLDLSSPEMSDAKQNSLNRKRKKLNHSGGTSGANSSYTSCAMCLLWAAFAIILICTTAFIIACATVYVRSPRKSNSHGNSFHLMTINENMTAHPTRENLLSDVQTSSTSLPTKSSSILGDLFKIEFKIDFNNDEPKTVPPPPSTSSTSTTTPEAPTTTVKVTTMATTPDQSSEDPFEETLRNEIKAELDRRPSAKSSSDFDFKSSETVSEVKSTRKPFGTLFPFFKSTIKEDDPNSDFIPVLKNKELTKPPSLSDLIGFVKKLLKTEQLIFKTNF